MSTFTSFATSTPVMPRLSHPVLRIVLFFALALSVALPTSALAAPMRQPTSTAEAELLAYYESDAIEVDDTEVYVGLYFYDDNTFELSLDFTGDDEDTYAYGDYEETDDGVVLTLLGADNEDFDESLELELLWDADDTLVIVGEPGGLMGDEDIILYPVDLEDAPLRAEGDDDADDAGDDDLDFDLDSDDDFSFGIAGVYASPVQAEDNVVYLLNLLPGGRASLNSDYLNLEPPIFEVGTWTDNGDDTVTVEITGTVAGAYDNPILINFTVGGYGELVIENIYLYPLGIFNYLQDDFADDSEDEIGSTESDVFVYVAEVTYPDATEATYVYLFIYDDGTIIMTDEAETGTLYGEWTFEEGILSVSITGDADGDFEGTVELVFELDDDNALVATEYPVEVFGEDELIFYPADSDDDEPVSEGEFYFYESDPLEIEGLEDAVISVVLSADGAAMISTDYGNDEEPSLEFGEWTRDEDGAVIISITESVDEVYDEPYVFTFEEDEDDLFLVLVEESVEIFGEAGLVLYRVE